MSNRTLGIFYICFLNHVGCLKGVGMLTESCNIAITHNFHFEIYLLPDGQVEL